MARYVKKPIEIEAFQLNGRGLVTEGWFWDAVTRNEIIIHCFGKHEIEDAWCEIKTLEGTMIANTGDYIIRGIKGEIYPCNADIFEATYNTPTADVVEIPCRCDKCKYSKIHTCAITGIKTFFCDYGVHPFVVEPTHFCSYGERRTDDDL